MRITKILRRALVGLAPSTGAVALVLALGTSGSAVACGGGDDGPASPRETVCSRVSLSSNGLSIRTDCSSISSTISNIQFDQFGRRISWTFDIRCTTGTERYTGRVTSVTYNNLGQALSATVEINGTTCRV
ncbi:MAG: hypothetical protein ACT4R6_01715 [Gemmatimonadaceae bacterium]